VVLCDVLQARVWCIATCDEEYYIESFFTCASLLHISLVVQVRTCEELEGITVKCNLRTPSRCRMEKRTSLNETYSLYAS
jgi:hypothetical protein